MSRLPAVAAACHPVLLMSDLRKTLGLLGLVAACGPVAPQTTASSDASTGEAETSAGTATDPTDPTDPTGTASDPTNTTTPPPECVDSTDCFDTYCGYCDNGVCKSSGGCCGYDLGKPARPDAQRWRCSPPYDCYSDYDCQDGYVCSVDHFCVPGTNPLLPPCADPGEIVGQWKLSVTPGAFILADLDADGDLDLAAAQPSVAQIEVALNDGTGNFILAGAFGVGAPTDALAIAHGDLDGDGDNDLAALRRDPAGGLILLFGQDAVFTAQPPLPTAATPGNLLIADLNSDKFQDLLTIDPVQVIARLGNPKADYSVTQVALNQIVDPQASLFDFDKSGSLDIVATLPGTTAIGLWKGKGDGFFTPHASLDTGMPQNAPLYADINLLPVPDIEDLPSVILTRSLNIQGDIEVFAGINAPQMFAESVHFGTSFPITGNTLAELDLPAGPDLLAATGQPVVLIALGDGEGGFSCERVIKTFAPTVQSLVAAGDLNGDGRVDLIVGDPNSPEVSVHLTP